MQFNREFNLTPVREKLCVLVIVYIMTYMSNFFGDLCKDNIQGMLRRVHIRRLWYNAQGRIQKDIFNSLKVLPN